MSFLEVGIGFWYNVHLLDVASVNVQKNLKKEAVWFLVVE